MRPLRPVVALLANIVLIHAMWIGSNFSCATLDQTGSRASQTAGNDMSAANMSGMGMDDGSGGASAPAGVPADRHAPCRIPWSPDGCQSLTPCLPLAMTAPAQALRGNDAHPVAIRTLTTIMPPSLRRAPEPPPPRA